MPPCACQNDAIAAVTGGTKYRVCLPRHYETRGLKSHRDEISSSLQMVSADVHSVINPALTIRAMVRFRNTWKIDVLCGVVVLFCSCQAGQLVDVRTVCLIWTLHAEHNWAT